MTLNHRQQVFADAILSGSTGKAAAIAAGYSEHTAESQASRLLRNAKVKAFLDKAQAKAVEAAQLSAEETLGAIKEGLDFDPAQLFGEKGELLSVREMPLAVRRNLRGVKLLKVLDTPEGPAQILEVKWTPRSEHIGHATRVLGLNKDRVEHSGEVGIAVHVAINGVTKGGK